MNRLLTIATCLVLLGLTSAIDASGSTDEPRFYVWGAWHDLSTEKLFWRGSPIGIGVDVHREGKLVYDEVSCLQGVRFAVLQVRGGKRAGIDVRVIAPPEVQVYGDHKGTPRRYGRWYILTELGCGDYVLQVTVPDSAGMAQPREPELPFRIVEPGNEDEWAWTLGFRAHVILGLGRFEEAEELAWEVGRRYGIERLPWLTLAEIFDATGDVAKSLEFMKEGMRRHIRKTGDSVPLLEPPYPSLYVQRAVAIGEAKDEEEADSQMMDLVERTRNAEDTGSIPDSYLEPLSRPGVSGHEAPGPEPGSPADAAPGPTRLRRVVVTLCGLGLCVGFLLIAAGLWRRRAKHGNGGKVP